jgi:hypothetical protein
LQSSLQQWSLSKEKDTLGVYALIFDQKTMGMFENQTIYHPNRLNSNFDGEDDDQPFNWGMPYFQTKPDQLLISDS